MATEKSLCGLLFAALAPALLAQWGTNPIPPDASAPVKDKQFQRRYWSTMRIVVEDLKVLPGPPTFTSNCAIFEPIGWSLVHVTPLGAGATKFGPPCYVFISMAGYRTSRVSA